MFNNNALRYEIQSLCLSEADLSFFHIFNKHAPIEKNYLRGNESYFMTIELHVAIMKKSLPRNRFSKEKNQANRDNYKIQRNLCKTLLRKTRNSYISNLDKNSHRDIITDEGKDCY